MKTAPHTGIAIALAWPQTYCKQPGAWYDGLMLRLGINVNHYYQVGHAALVLIDGRTSKAYYFDFGRYHAPFQHGRARGANTDPELHLHTTAQLSEDGRQLLNYEAFLEELQNNAACHGDGELVASYCPIDFDRSRQMVQAIQAASPMPYGPFIKGGSNCSRFVNTVIRAGATATKDRFKLRYFQPLSPTPMGNVNALPHVKRQAAAEGRLLFEPLYRLNQEQLTNTLLSPERHANIPPTAQWLSGEGAGSWYDVNMKDSQLQVSRYSPQGQLEFEATYQPTDHLPTETYKLSYPSHYQEITLESERKKYRFTRVVEG